MTLACILLGTWVSRSIRQRNALAGLDKSEMDLRVYYDYEFDANGKPTGADPPGPAWLREPLGIDFFATVVGIDFYRGATDANLGWLTQLPGLRTCEIFESPLVTDEGIAQLAHIGSLKTLGLYNLQISDRGLASLQGCPSLETLTLYLCENLTNAGTAQLCGFKRLRRLDLDFCGAIDDTMLESLEAMSSLRELELTYRGRNAGAGLKFLGKLPHLESLTLYGNEGFSDAAFLQLTAPGLKCLSLFHCDQLTDDALATLEKLPGLERLYLSRPEKMGDGAMAHLPRLPKLKQLWIYGEAFALTDAGLQSIALCPQLRRLSLLACGNVTDAGVQSLARLSGLEELVISVDHLNQLSPAALANLRAQLPKCQVEYRKEVRGF